MGERMGGAERGAGIEAGRGAPPWEKRSRRKRTTRRTRRGRALAQVLTNLEKSVEGRTMARIRKWISKATRGGTQRARVGKKKYWIRKWKRIRRRRRRKTWKLRRVTTRHARQEKG